MHEVQVQLLDHLGMLDQHLGHEGAGLQVAAALELEHVALRADDRPFLEARQQAAFLGRRAGRPGAPAPARTFPLARDLALGLALERDLAAMRALR